MQIDPIDIQFDSRRPWRTLMNLFWPERRPIFLALLSYLFNRILSLERGFVLEARSNGFEAKSFHHRHN